MTSAVVFVIGDEILHGEITDQNGPWLIEQFNEMGINLQRCSILPDEPAVISGEIKRFLDCDYIVTTGGIGPTHDDRTLEAVAEALDRPLETDHEMIELLRDNHGTLNESQKDMCLRPEGGTFHNLQDSVGLAFEIENVYVFPGFPELLKPLFFKLEDHFEGEPLHTVTIQTDGLESDIAGLLGEYQENYPDLEFGSYPHTDGSITVKIRGRNENRVQKVSQSIQDEL